MKNWFLILGLFLLIAPLQAQEKWLWRLHWTAGQNYVLTTETTSISVSQVPTEHEKTEELTSENTSRIVMDYDVLAVDEKDNVTIRLTYRSLENETVLRGPEGVRFDSKNPPPNSPDTNAPLRAMAGLSLQSVIAPDGKVLKIEGLKALVEKTKASFEKLNDPQTRAVAQQIFDATFSEKNLRAMVEKSVGTLPPAPLDLGQSWNYQFEVPLGLVSMNIEGQRTLAGRGAGVATITETAEFSSTLKGEELPDGAGTLQIEFAGQLTGVTTVDEATGLALESHISQKMKGKITLAVPDKPTMITPLNTDIEIVTTMKPRLMEQ